MNPPIKIRVTNNAQKPNSTTSDDLLLGGNNSNIVPYHLHTWYNPIHPIITNIVITNLPQNVVLCFITQR